MKHPWIFLLFIGSIAACKNSPTGPVEKDTTATDTKSYLPVNDFIREDIKQVDSFAGGILLKTTGTVKKDSAFIQPGEFKELTREFFSPELDSAIFYNQFSETSLMDESTKMLNFIYTSNSTATEIRKVIVYVSPSLSTDKVSRIYMEKELSRGDTAISRKLTWKMKQYLVIAEMKQTAGGYNSTRIRKAIWDPQLYAD